MFPIGPDQAKIAANTGLRNRRHDGIPSDVDLVTVVPHFELADEAADGIPS